MRLYKTKVKRKLHRPETGQVKVTNHGLIQLGPKWSEPIGLKVGDTVKIRREGTSHLVLTKGNAKDGGRKSRR